MKLSFGEKFGIGMVLTWIVAFCLCVYGWAMNVVALVGMIGPSTDISTMFIARVIGVFFAPLGVVLGFVG